MGKPVSASSFLGMKKETLEAELLEDQGDETDPLDLRAVFFRPRRLDEAERSDCAQDLFGLIKDFYESSSDLMNLLAHWNDLAEGIAPPKNFPWENSSNLHVPLTEAKLNEVHSASRQTLLKANQLFFVSSLGLPVTLDKSYKLEQFLNFKVQVELPLVGKFSELIWSAGKDGTSIAQVSWVDKRRPVMELKTYKTAEEFTAANPAPGETGLSKGQYDKVLARLAEGKPVRLVETVEKSVYKGPRVDVVELQDFVMSPMTSISTENARLVGKVFSARGPELWAMAQEEGWTDEQVQAVIDSNEDGQRQNNGNELKDQIEGISRRSGKGEFIIFNGIYRKDLDDDGIEENYLVFFHPLTQTILGDLIHYPYLHGRDCFVPVRIKKRTNRFLGRGICQMLDDINQELNTQHNQRIDSRTISTVPTFKALNSARGNFDTTRPDTRFSPGKVFYLSSLNDVEQFKVNETDFTQSMTEEQNTMSLADRLTGSSQLRSGQETKMDPRAPAAKIAMLKSSSDVRLDDYFEEIAGNGQENTGLNAIGAQILALYHQFWDDSMGQVPALKNGKPQAPGQGDPDPNGLKTIAVTQDDLDTQGKALVCIAKTSAAQNPDNMVMKYMQLYSLLSNDPLVGGRPGGRLQLDRLLLESMRITDIDKLLPADEQMAQQVMQIQAALLQQMQGGKGGGKGGKSRSGEARTRNGAKQAAVPGVPGSNRPGG